jgi:hypothetical protein
MTNPFQQDALSWDAVLVQCRFELNRLSAAERAWLKARLAAIEACQTELDRLFRLAEGPAVCTSCQERCCGCGRHHFTLTNLLGYLLQGLDPPRPDYSRTCPFLGPGGCRLAVALRPFNCITFICEAVEAGLNVADQAKFSKIEKQLRNEYEAVAGHYAGASMRGLLIAAERRNGAPFLQGRGSVSRLK